jgi:hypothetical protein
MDNLNDLKKIWLTADTNGLPNSSEIMRMGKNYRNKGLAKKIFLIAAALLLTALMVVVIFIYKSTMLSTRIGEGFIIIAGSILVYTNIRSIGRFYYFKDYSNKEFIAFLEQTRLNQIYYHNKTQVIGLSFSSIGLLLYLFETTYQHIVAGLIIYFVSGLLLTITWLVLRPRSFKKQTAKLNETMKKLKALSDQFKNEKYENE